MSSIVAKENRVPWRHLTVAVMVALAANAGLAAAVVARPAYLDAHAPVDARVADLLARMTVEEKVGQLNIPCVYLREFGSDNAARIEACRRFADGTSSSGLGPEGGFFAVSNSAVPEGARRQAQILNELQHVAVERTRLHVPLVEIEEGTHGLMAAGATVFPEGLALGSTWNMELIHRLYAVAAVEARAIGVHELCTLVIEPERDPRLGRNQEAFSEDPFLCSRMAATVVDAIQGGAIAAPDHTIAAVCHFPGQSQPAGGLERGAMEISERTLREVFLPPWTAAIRQAGALGVMATYPAIDGVPAHASSWLLTDILRRELGFEGVVLAEGSGLSTLVYEHIAPDQKTAGELAIKAGVDAGISCEAAFLRDMVANVHEGRVPVAVLDRAVARILQLKFRLGLFEQPYVDPERAARLTHTVASQALALEAAHESVVLLKNERQVLPLRKDLKAIAVIGPNADRSRSLLGDYVADVVLQPVTTILAAIKEKVRGGTRVEYVRGCDVLDTNDAQIDAAAAAARRADVAVVVVGENPRGEKEPTDGEGYDVASLDLTGRQEELVEAVYRTGTPTIVILNNGRPLSVRWIAEHVPAVIEGWLPGEQGGRAVADVLFGDFNPTGRLPITIPRHVGQLPAYYNAMPSKEYWLAHGWAGRRYADMSPLPLWEFGHGLSFTEFAYSDLRIETPRVHPGDDVCISATVRNTGKRRGAEVVQLYLRDLVSSVTTPIKQLRGLARISLAPGESQAVRFVLKPDDLALVNRQLRRVVEPGDFAVMIGHSSADIRLTGQFEVAE